MSNIAKLEFAALDISGKNYLSWILVAEIHLDAMNLGNTIKEGNVASQQDRAKALIFIRHHIDASLKSEYLTVKDPLILWNNLKERYDHQKTVILPKAHYDWLHLRLQDFKSVSDYNSAIFKISSQLQLCGEKITDEDMLEKTYTTFHASNMLLQQQYRERRFTRYSELIACLLVAEQNNELLLKNHQSRPTGSVSLPEANATSISIHKHGRGRGYHYGQGRGSGRGRSRGRGRHNSWNQGNFNQSQNKKNNSNNQKLAHSETLNGKTPGPHNKQAYETECYRCGMKGHWSRTCRTAKHLVDLYQASIKGKNKQIETNFIDGNDIMNFNDPHQVSPKEDGNQSNAKFFDDEGAVPLTNFDISDFFEDPSENLNHLIGGGNVCYD